MTGCWCLRSLTSQCRDECQDTDSRFLRAVPRYRLDWIVVSYSRVATGAFWDTLVVASGAPFILLADWCLTRSYSASHRHSDLLPVVRVKATIIGARVAFTRYATIH